ncbi:MAG TPA: glutathione peroxidase [Synechococcales cyanobacterium M55_K2018_004]|nr:glutathione peroxidase [Synechococcales cyanobacterium M55_K2018_004]
MPAQAPASIYEISATSIDGRSVSLDTYRGKVLLIVNTASQCGLTPHYKGLQALYEQYANQGFVVLGFPCNQFGWQEPGSSEQIQAFCEKNYGVSFPLFEKIEVNGSNAHPLYQYLKSAAPGTSGTPEIEWNFAKFLVDRNGMVVKRYAPTTNPEDIAQDVQALL